LLRIKVGLNMTRFS